MNFRKTSKRHLTPLALVSENYVAFFCTKLFGLEQPAPFSRKFIVFPLKITAKTAKIFLKMSPPPFLEFLENSSKMVQLMLPKKEMFVIKLPYGTSFQEWKRLMGR